MRVEGTGLFHFPHLEDRAKMLSTIFVSPKHSNMRTRTLLTCACTIILLFSGCLKEPGEVQLTCNVTSTTVGQGVTFTITGADHYTCVEWSGESGPAYSIIAGGGNKDLTMQCRFNTTGRAGVHVKVRNCKKGGCDGRCNEAEATLYLDVN
jgi:hypothetical protein